MNYFYFLIIQNVSKMKYQLLQFTQSNVKRSIFIDLCDSNSCTGQLEIGYSALSELLCYNPNQLKRQEINCFFFYLCYLIKISSINQGKNRLLKQKSISLKPIEQLKTKNLFFKFHYQFVVTINLLRLNRNMFLVRILLPDIE